MVDYNKNDYFKKDVLHYHKSSRNDIQYAKHFPVDGSKNNIAIDLIKYGTWLINYNLRFK